MNIGKLTPQYELDIITPQNEAAPRRPISKISIQNFEKVENLNSRIWKIVVQGIHITKYLRICNPSREWQSFQIQIGRLGAGSYWGVKIVRGRNLRDRNLQDSYRRNRTF